MQLDTVTRVLHAFYRLVDAETSDGGLVSQGEGDDEVAYTFLTRGCRNAQRWMLKMGYGGWRKRSAALSFSGTDAADGGRYITLPTDFLRAVGGRRNRGGSISALRQDNGDQWGTEVDDRDDTFKGNGYYLRGTQLWLLRTANPPSTLYLDYHYLHPEWDINTTIDFPLDARHLIVAEAGNVAKEESWLTGGPEMDAKIDRATRSAREEARDLSRQTRAPRQFGRPRRYGTHWMWAALLLSAYPITAKTLVCNEDLSSRQGSICE